jgi:hypothetical protein
MTGGPQGSPRGKEGIPHEECSQVIEATKGRSGGRKLSKQEHLIETRLLCGYLLNAFSWRERELLFYARQGNSIT